MPSSRAGHGGEVRDVIVVYLPSPVHLPNLLHLVPSVPLPLPGVGGRGQGGGAPGDAPPYPGTGRPYGRRPYPAVVLGRGRVGVAGGAQAMPVLAGVGCWLT